MPCVATTKRTEKRQQAAALQITPNKKSGNRAGKLGRSMLRPYKEKAAAEAAASCAKPQFDLKTLYHGAGAWPGGSSG